MARLRPGDLLSVDDIASEYELSRSSVWNVLRRHQVPRFRTAATGKTTLVRRANWEQALHTPVPVIAHSGPLPTPEKS